MGNEPSFPSTLDAYTGVPFLEGALVASNQTKSAQTAALVLFLVGHSGEQFILEGTWWKCPVM